MKLVLAWLKYNAFYGQSQIFVSNVSLTFAKIPIRDETL
jgi:hypothetical protein